MLYPLRIGNRTGKRLIEARQIGRTQAAGEIPAGGRRKVQIVATRHVIIGIRAAILISNVVEYLRRKTEAAILLD